MKIGLTEASEVTYFANVIKLLGTINEEMTVDIGPEGISVLSMDSSHVAMIDLKLKSSAFGEYEVEEAFKLSFNIDELKKRLDAIEAKKELVTIKHDEPNAKLVLEVREPETRRRREMSIKLMDPLDEEVPKPKIRFQGNMRILLDDLDRAIKDAQMVSQHIIIKAQAKPENMISFTGIGDLGDSLLEINDPLECKVDADDGVAATYTLSYLASYANAIKPFTSIIRLEMSTDMPIKCTADGNPNLECDFYLAPCIGV